MADTKISGATLVTAPALTDEYATNQGGAAKRTPLNLLAQFADANAYAALGADYTLTSATTAQKLFNNSANGALTIPSGLYYLFCQLQITGMSATSGNGVFQLGGTATLVRRMLSAIGVDATAMATGAAGSFAMIQGASAFTTNTVLAATGTGMGVKIEGIIDCTVGGTLIPQIALTTAAAAVVKAGSFFILNKIGETGDTSRGSWS